MGKLIYTALIGVVAVWALLQIWRVWRDDTLYIGKFTYLREGLESTPDGDSFAVSVAAHQKTLLSLFAAD